MKLPGIDEAMKRGPEGMALVAYIHERMVTQEGNVKAEKQRVMGLHGQEEACQVIRARPSKLQQQQIGVWHDQSLPQFGFGAESANWLPRSSTTPVPTWEISSGRYISRRRESCPTQGCCEFFTRFERGVVDAGR